MKKTGIMLTALMLMLLSGCGGFAQGNSGDAQEKDPAAQTAQEKPENDQEEAKADEQQEESKSETPGTTQVGSVGKISAESLAGDWTFVCWTDYSSEKKVPIEEMDKNTYMGEEDGGKNATISIYEDGGKLYADYSIQEYESSTTGYHMPVETVQEPLYETCDNQEWYAKVVNPHGDEPVLKVTLVGKDQLQIYSSWESEDVEYPWFSVTVDTYLRDGSEEMAHKDDFRYNKTVTVSTVDEFVTALENNTKIIFKGGVYNFQDISDKINRYGKNLDISMSDNKKIVKLKDLSYLGLAAEEGAKVEICVESPYDPVVDFEYCNNVDINGITFGHRVEPGTCGGSVLRFLNSGSVVCEDCHLYGCGAYGVDATDCYNIRVVDTEIFECTYGITSLYNTYNVEFSGCNMHDNSKYAMIDLYNSGDITFDTCFFANNDSSEYDYTAFVNSNESYNVAFRNCNFTDNKYRRFADGEVETDNCTFKDIAAAAD